MHIYTVNIAGNPQEILSLLSPEIVSVIGLPTQGILGRFPEHPGKENSISSRGFVPNPVFINFLHSTILKYSLDLKGLCIEAYRQQNGWVYILDGRCSTPQGEVESDDIIGAFEVKEGKILPESYQKNNNYLILSSKGLCKFESQLQGYLINDLRQLSISAGKN